jgi:hypothetical protein
MTPRCVKSGVKEPYRRVDWGGRRGAAPRVANGILVVESARRRRRHRRSNRECIRNMNRHTP